MANSGTRKSVTFKYKQIMELLINGHKFMYK